ncbi:MAG: molybdopterin molybdotransferase MoeA [Desulfobulbaceae bacterium]|nr:molybdopterin molybdotransferase MoeA [Desulfobulbaceae bacterium]
MISLNEAVAIVKNNLPPSGEKSLSLAEALGHFLAEDIVAPEPSPRYTNSAMDGIAVRFVDVAGAKEESPVLLTIIGESRAGLPFSGSVGVGEAVRISTGAMLADGADTVIRLEETREAGNSVAVLAVRKKGQDVRRQGEEFETGTLLLRRGTRLAAPQAALLAAVGIDHVRVFTPCTVALLVTGSELVAAGDQIERYQIRDSNMMMLQAAVREAGGNLLSSRRVVDEREATSEAIATSDADIILCTGGVSVGRHDHVKEAAEENGFAPLFWRIRQKPGKPLYCARKGNTLLFGLPGNPVSAFMCFAHYVRPVLGALCGQPFGWPSCMAQAVVKLTNKGSRPNMVRVRLTATPEGGHGVGSVEHQGSHMLTSLAEANGYVILEPGQSVDVGEMIRVYSYDFRCEPGTVWRHLYLS